jgi:hypothetical protein
MRYPFGPASVAALVASCAFVAGCSSGSTTVPVLAPPIATPTPVPTPSAVPTLPAPPIPAASPFSASQAVAVSVPTAAPGATAPPVAIPVPAGAGITATIGFPAAQASIPPNTVVSVTATNVLPQGLPVLARLRAPRAAQGATAVIEYQTLLFSNQASFAAQPSFTFGVPANYAGVSGVSYYVAQYDAYRPQLGWMRGFEGPGTVSGSTISFTGQAGPYVFFANQPQYFALYAVSAAAAAPTPAPSVAPLPTPAPLSAAPNAVELNAPGASATVALTDAASGYSGGYTVTSADPTVATATASGTTVTVTAVAPGTTAVTVRTTDGRQALISVGVTTTTVPVQ